MLLLNETGEMMAVRGGGEAVYKMAIVTYVLTNTGKLVVNTENTGETQGTWPPW